MRKLVVGAMISLDGVMQAPGGPTEDPTGGFAHGGWVMPYYDEVFAEEIDLLLRDFDLLLGRKTYEIFAAYWPYYDEAERDGGIASKFRDIRKYLVSRSGKVDTDWNGSVLLRGVDEVARLKQGEGPRLVTQGSTELVHALFAADLVDELCLFTLPVVLGGGKKLFADGSAPRSFKLERSHVSSTGLIAAWYERSGGIAIGQTELEAPSEREVARQARMLREG